MKDGASMLDEAEMYPLNGRSFFLLDQDERERLGTVLRPLAWIDGLIAALIIAPAGGEEGDGEEDDIDEDNVEKALEWLDHIWNEESEAKQANLTALQSARVVIPVMDHYGHVASTMIEDPEAYRPYLAGFDDPLEAAAQWAAGFCTGISLAAEAWEPLFANEEAAPALVAIFSLLRAEDIPEEVRAEVPPLLEPEEAERMRRTAAEMLPGIVQSLHDIARDFDQVDDLDFDDDLDLDEDGGLDRGEDGQPVETYVRPAPKVGRNDPCPCGSGKKYKKCCLGKE
jgi:uncharacterized protein